MCFQIFFLFSYLLICLVFVIVFSDLLICLVFVLFFSDVLFCFALPGHSAVSIPLDNKSFFLLLEGDFAFVYLKSLSVCLHLHARWRRISVCVVCHRSRELYCLLSHCHSLHRVAAYLHKVKVFSTLPHLWTDPQLVANARCHSCWWKSPTHIENEWSPVALLLWVTESVKAA